MKGDAKRRFKLACCVFAFLAPVAVAAAEPAARTTRPCGAPEYRQFDFFAGDWDTYDVGGPAKVIAHNKVDVILGGCVIREDYRQDEGMHGMSFSLYDAARGLWHQSWVTSRGELLLLDGGMQGGRMVFTGAQKTDGGKPSLLRGVWYRQGSGVRETATRSTDGGKSWQPVFDIIFKPRKPGA